MGFTNKQQEYLLNATKRWNVKSGAVRSGKTYLDILAVIPLRLRKMAGKEGLVVFLGNTKGTLQRNIIEPLQAKWGLKYVSDINSSNVATIFGQKVYCLGANKVNQVDILRGSSVKYCYGDEVVTWNKDVFRMLQSRLDKSYSCCDLTCNPDSPLHWFNDFLHSAANIYLQAYQLDDNKFLDEEVKKSIKLEYVKGSVWYQRYVEGLWVLAEGLIYPMFSPTEHVISDADIPECDAYYLTLDYGIMNPFACYVVGTKDQDVYIIDEYYYDGRAERRTKTDRQYYEKMEQMAEPYFQKMRNRGMLLEVIHDPSATSIKAEIDTAGKFASRAGKNQVIDGIQDVARKFSLNQIHINSKCSSLIKELQTYSWDNKEHDKPIKEFDHSCDALRYFIHTIKLGQQISFN